LQVGEYGGRVIRSVLAGYVGLAWTRVSGFLALPLLLMMLGPQVFGAWALADSFSGSQALIDLGVVTATAKFAADADAAGDMAGLRRTIWLSLVWYGLLGLVYAAGVMVLLPAVGKLLHLPPQLTGPAQTLFLGSIALFSLSNASAVFAAGLNALQRGVIINIAYSTFRLAYLGLLFGSWAIKSGAAGIVVATLASAAMLTIWLLVALLLVTKDQGRFQQSHVRIRDLLHFGAQTYVAGLADFCTIQAPKAILGLSIGAVAAGQADLAYRLPVLAMITTYPVASSLLPGAARLRAHGRPAEIEALALRATRYTAAASQLVFGIVFIFGPTIMRLVAGRAAAGLATPIRCIAAGFLVITVTVPLTYIMTGMGLPREVARFKLLLAGATLALMIPAVLAGGIAAGALAAFVAAVIAVAYLLRGPVNLVAEGAGGALARVLVRPGLALIVAAGVTAAAVAALGLRLDSLAALGVFCASDVAALKFTGSIGRPDLELVISGVLGRARFSAE
jgi:O-antigen/teichoic acid export membrane protein